MNRFLTYIILFCVVIAGLDLGYGFVANYLRTNAKGGETLVDNYIADISTDSVLIFGSSRAKEQYKPDIFKDTLRMSCFNCGKNGMGIICLYGIWKIISQRYTPKVIVYDILPVLDLHVRDDNEIYINPLRPWYDVPGVDSIFRAVDHNERYQMLANSYRYHSKLMDYVKDFSHEEPLGNGYHSNGNKTIQDIPQNFTQKLDYERDPLKLFFLEKFIQETKGKTTLIFVASPRFMYEESGNAFAPLITLCEKYDIPFLNHYNDKKFIYEKNYYADETHFNEKGASVWSELISHEIKSLLAK